MNENWVRPCDLMKIYKLSRTTIYRYTKAMKSKVRYKDSVLRASKKCTLIDLSAFKKFLIEQDKTIERSL